MVRTHILLFIFSNICFRVTVCKVIDLLESYNNFFFFFYKFTFWPVIFLFPKSESLFNRDLLSNELLAKC